MPQEQTEGTPEDSPIICARCRVSAPTLVIRFEQLCNDCFMNYVTSKVTKRMDPYKVRGSSNDPPRRVLLPLSFGLSSLSLLHVLDRQIRTQLARANRAGYELYVLHVNQQCVGEPVVDGASIDAMKQQYPMHSYFFAQIEEAVDHTFISDINDLMAIGLEEDSHLQQASWTGKVRLEKLLSSLPSHTSRADIVNVLRTRLIVKFAKEKDCESIVWGDSTTRLAERTLAETAKGRGFSLPWQMGDGPSPHGVTFLFPMREILRKEVLTYAELTSPPLTEFTMQRNLEAPFGASSKDITIDGLMMQYFETVEQNYPSIVANVVRTSGRLEGLPLSSQDLQCRICSLPIAENTQGLHGWEHRGSTAQEDQACGTMLCYGCARSIQDPKRVLTTKE